MTPCAPAALQQRCCPQMIVDAALPAAADIANAMPWATGSPLFDRAVASKLAALAGGRHACAEHVTADLRNGSEPEARSWLHTDHEEARSHDGVTEACETLGGKYAKVEPPSEQIS